MWADVEAQWADVIDQVRDRWPETAVPQLREIGGNLTAFIHYLADVHDLTRGEARDAIEEWLWTAGLAQSGDPQDRRVLVAE